MPLFPTHNVTRRRYAASTVNSEGVGVDGATTDTTVACDVQPARQQDLQRLPEGYRTRSTLRVFVDTGVLKTADQAAGTRGDQVIIAEAPYAGTYDVSLVEDFGSFLIPGSEALVTKVQEAI
jgi:hypothetical protein